MSSFGETVKQLYSPKYKFTPLGHGVHGQQVSEQKTVSYSLDFSLTLANESVNSNYTAPVKRV